jgi:hypothetical protein
MIARSYYYRITHQGRPTAFGVVTTRSWRADPVSAMRHAVDEVCELRRWKTENIIVESFNRV